MGVLLLLLLLLLLLMCCSRGSHRFAQRGSSRGKTRRGFTDKYICMPEGDDDERRGGRDGCEGIKRAHRSLTGGEMVGVECGQQMRDRRKGLSDQRQGMKSPPAGRHDFVGQLLNLLLTVMSRAD